MAEEIGAIATSPSRDNLFKIRDESEAVHIPEELAVSFNRTMVQLLYIVPRRRRDIIQHSHFNNKSKETRRGKLDEIKLVFEVPEG